MVRLSADFPKSRTFVKSERRRVQRVFRIRSTTCNCNRGCTGIQDCPPFDEEAGSVTTICGSLFKWRSKGPGNHLAQEIGSKVVYYNKPIQNYIGNFLGEALWLRSPQIFIRRKFLFPVWFTFLCVRRTTQSEVDTFSSILSRLAWISRLALNFPWRISGFARLILLVFHTSGPRHCYSKVSTAFPWNLTKCVIRDWSISWARLKIIRGEWILNPELAWMQAGSLFQVRWGILFDPASCRKPVDNTKYLSRVHCAPR